MRLFRSLLAAAAILAVSQLPAKAGQTGPLYCNQAASYDAATAQTLQEAAAAGVGSSGILICGMDATAAAAQLVQLVTGTGTNCGTNTANLTPNFNISTTPFKLGSSLWAGLQVASGLNVCVKTGNAVSTQVEIYWAYTE